MKGLEPLRELPQQILSLSCATISSHRQLPQQYYKNKTLSRNKFLGVKIKWTQIL